MSGDEAFGADLYGWLPGQGNLVFSPASIATALRLVLLGARGETAAQIAAALHLATPDGAAPAGLAAQELQDVSALLADLAAGPLTLRAPNAMWVQSGLPLQPGFTAAVAAAAAVAVRDADFRQGPEQARQEINQFIAEQTAGKISNLLSPGVVSAATSLVLASAVYLKAAWAHPFPAGATQDAVFHLDPGHPDPGHPDPAHQDSGTQVMAPTMRVRARLRYLRGDGYQAVELPYTGGRLGMVIVLPDTGQAGGAARDASLGGLSAGLAPRQVSLALPRFRVTSGFALGPVLAALGMPLAFTDEADFSGITTAQRLRIDEVVHQAYIDVNEAGTEAAAATAAVITAAARFMDPQLPVEMIVDRPFRFAITDLRSGLPLFRGRVADPTAG
ncbi:MAG TPA: serpin family protein [Streptosporangiaceae bacterium]|nr:serpin family protein [Streptosporangiaceae bacterium]